ncbi:Stn1 domain-containing protein [Favolaschia claudopus]|uniref:CST complex subunit STN1 n=1 Tax=Favolaschia claudopus TaxID=2862362 RepID=A0AAW0BZ09_9AGAR
MSSSRPYSEAESSTSQRHAPINLIWNWTLTPEAIAPCFARDVLDMAESGVRDAEFFWLGRIPCRSVKLVGLVVGIQAYESRIVYHVDDGTAVIECQHRPAMPNQGKSKDQEVLPLLQPIAYVGCTVVVIGRVASWHDTRRILVDTIARCSSCNEEPEHWINVGTLHKTHYYVAEPFTLPARAAPQTQPPPSVLETVSRPATPSSTHSHSVASSPVKSSTQASPHKLRHPSKLHTRDLTDNAFRIYLKHFMDYADELELVPPEPSTPTKSSRYTLPPSDETPRPHRHEASRIVPIDFTHPPPPADDVTRGFTLSYLRRVPELSLMAKRVVKAEAKRRAREAHKRAKEAKDGVPGKKPVVTQTMRNDQQKLHPRMKRLFSWAILQLVKEGDVILWEGSVYPCPAKGAADPDSSALWKSSSSTSTAGGNSTVFSSVSIAEDDEDEGELTDPYSDEEAYVSLTPAVLATTIESTIAKLVARAAARDQARTDSSRPRPRMRGGGATVQEIMSYLKADDMWRNLSEFAVKEALVFLKDEGRAWNPSADRWDLSL